ncbi:toll-like receptor 4 [Liolophura sinensis]|uniref:toll-like receptor 4 n=1 Tax=Liolophura sinensis TaxID=3198878 RepID=UPI003159352B
MMSALLETVFWGFLLTLLHRCISTKNHCHFDTRWRFLDCRNRGLREIPIHEFHFGDILGIDISHNNITILKNLTFINVTGLLTLDLSHNAISRLESDAFVGLNRLTSLNLSDNPFVLSPTVLTPELFQPLISLQEITIKRYRNSEYLNWKGIDASFAELRNLTKLLMNFPTDFVFEKGFQNLTKLIGIFASGRPELDGDCVIGTLRNSTFEAFREIPVKELHLVHCNIDTIELDAFDPLRSLTTLDLTYNQGVGLPNALKSLYSLQGRKMEAIKFSHVNNATCGNSKFSLYQSDCEYLKTICVKSLDMSQNYINFVDDSLEPKVKLDCIEKVNISFHSLRCVPWKLLMSMENATRLTDVDISYGFGAPNYDSNVAQRFSIRGNTDCNISDLEIFFPPALVRLNMSDVSSWLHLHSDINIKSGGNLRQVVAAYNNLDNCAGSILRGVENLTDLDISGMICHTIPSEYFRSFPKLTKLSLSNSPKMDMALVSTTRPFALLTDLEDIDLSGNKLVEIHPELFHNNKNLRSINLANNKLRHLPAALFNIPRLRQLDLSYNVFSNLLADEMRFLDGWMLNQGGDSSFRLLLGNNPFQCTCDTILFIRWILQRTAYIDNFEAYSCYLSNGSRSSVIRFAKDLVDFEVKCVSQTYLIISVVGSLTLLTLILLTAAIYRYRSNLRYWLYTKLKPPEKMFDHRQYDYDAFVAYTSDDHLWILQVLRVQLELADEPVKLCLHERDFLPGKPIHQNIVDKIRESRKILLIISVAFLESTFGPLEIEYAGMKCLEEGRDDVIVCILLEDIPIHRMSKALRNLWHKITFVKWTTVPEDQDALWAKVRRALR